MTVWLACFSHIPSKCYYRRFAALSRFLRPATWVWYNAVSLRLLQVAVLRGYSEGRYFAATVTGATVHAVATEYHQSTVKDTCTPTCRGHIGTALYKSYIAGQEDSGCVITHTMEKKLIFLLSTHAQSFQYPYQPQCQGVGWWVQFSCASTSTINLNCTTNVLHYTIQSQRSTWSQYNVRYRSAITPSLKIIYCIESTIILQFY